MKAARAARKRTVSLYEGDAAELHDDNGILTATGLTVLKASIQNPANHRTVDLGIKEFKRYLKRIPMMTKGTYNRLVQEYKEKGWRDYAELVKFKGSFPTNNGQYKKEEKNVKEQPTKSKRS